MAPTAPLQRCNVYQKKEKALGTRGRRRNRERSGAKGRGGRGRRQRTDGGLWYFCEGGEEVEEGLVEAVGVFAVGGVAGIFKPEELFVWGLELLDELFELLAAGQQVVATGEKERRDAQMPNGAKVGLLDGREKKMLRRKLVSFVGLEQVTERIIWGAKGGTKHLAEGWGFVKIPAKLRDPSAKGVKRKKRRVGRGSDLGEFFDRLGAVGLFGASQGFGISLAEVLLPIKDL